MGVLNFLGGGGRIVVIKFGIICSIELREGSWGFFAGWREFGGRDLRFYFFSSFIFCWCF